jgi:hypothetical protein
MKPNWKDYLKAIGQFILLSLVAIVAGYLIVLGLSHATTLLALIMIVVVGFSVLLILLACIEVVREFAEDSLRKRLDKDDEM